jgi:hypothetical protein
MTKDQLLHLFYTYPAAIERALRVCDALGIIRHPYHKKMAEQLKTASNLTDEQIIELRRDGALMQYFSALRLATQVKGLFQSHAYQEFKAINGRWPTDNEYARFLERQRNMPEDVKSSWINIQEERCLD